ncbi:MAG: hypothetical protein ACI8WA_000018 [Polaribacter sp.]
MDNSGKELEVVAELITKQNKQKQMIKIDYKERAEDLANDNIKLMDKNSSLNSENEKLKMQLLQANVVGQSEQLKKFWEYFDKESIAINCNDKERDQVIKDFFN